MLVKPGNIITIENRMFIISDVWMYGENQNTVDMYEVKGEKIKKDKSKIDELIGQGKIKIAR